MKRNLRRLLNLLATLSLLPCAALICWRLFTNGHTVSYPITISSVNGLTTVTYAGKIISATQISIPNVTGTINITGTASYTTYDFQLGNSLFPFAAALILSLIAPALWLSLFIYRWRVARRASSVNHCLICGYDLRATPDRCPECGAIPPH